MWEFDPNLGKYIWVPKTNTLNLKNVKNIQRNVDTDESISNWVSSTFNRKNLEEELDNTTNPFYKEEIKNYLNELDQNTTLNQFDYLTSPTSSNYKIEDKTTENYFKYLKKAEDRLGKPLLTSQDPYQVLAKDQSTAEQWGRTLGNLSPNILLGILETVGYLGELPKAIIGSDRDFSNTLTEFASQNKNFLFGETYRMNPEKVFDFSDSAWWLQHGAGLFESIAQFAAVGAGVGSVLAKSSLALARALNLGKTGTKVVAGLIPQVTTSATLAYSEGAMSGAQVYKQVYSDLLQKTGDENYAKLKASESASTTVLLNTGINTLLNLYSVAPLFKTTKGLSYSKKANLMQQPGELSRDYLKRLSSLPETYSPSIKKSLKRYGLEAPLEATEEVVNLFSEKRGLDNRGVFSTDDFLKDFVETAFSDEGILSASLGAIGGIGNIAAVDNIPSIKKSDNKLGYTLGPSVRQKEVEEKKKQYAATIFSIKEDLKDYFTTLDELKKASDEGNVNKIKEAQEKLFNISTRRSVVEGVGESLIGTLEEIKNVDNVEIGSDGKTEAMRQGLTESTMDNSYKKKAEDKINDIKYFQSEYESFSSRFSAKDQEAPGYLKHVFSAFINQHTSKQLYSEAVKNNNEAKANLNKLRDILSQEIISLPEEEKIKAIKELEKELQNSPEIHAVKETEVALLQSKLQYFTDLKKFEDALDFSKYKKTLENFQEENENKSKSEKPDEDVYKNLREELINSGYSPTSTGVKGSFVFDLDTQDGPKRLIAERTRDGILIKDPNTGHYIMEKGAPVKFTEEFYSRNASKISIVPMAIHMEQRKAEQLKKRRKIQIEALEAVTQDFENEIRSLNTQIKNAEESIKNANKEIEELQNDLSKHIKDRTHKLNKKEINKRIKELNKTIKSLKSTIPQLEFTRDALFPKLEALRIVEEELRSIPEEEKISIENTITDIVDFIKQLPSVSDTLQNLENVLSYMEDGILSLREEINKLENIVKEIQDLLKDNEYISALQSRAIMEATFRAKYPGFPIPVKGLYDALEFNKNREAVNAYLRRLAREQERTLDEVREEFTDHLMTYDEAELKAKERFELEEDLKVANSRLLEARQTLKEYLDTYVAKSEDRNNLLKLKLIADNLQSEISTIAKKAQSINIRSAITDRLKNSQISGEPEILNPNEGTVMQALNTFLSSYVFYTTGANVEYETNAKGEITGTKYDDKGNPIIKSGYQKGWFAFLDKQANTFNEGKPPYKLKLVVRTDPNTPSNLKALMDKEVGTKGSDLDVGAFLVDEKENLITINDKGEFDPEGYPAFTFLPKAESLFKETGPKVNWNGLISFYLESNPGSGSFPSLKGKSDDTEINAAGKTLTVGEAKKMLVDNAIKHYTTFIEKVEANQSKGAFVEIQGVSNGIALRAKDPATNKYKYQSLKDLLKQRKTKLKKIHVAKGIDSVVTINSIRYFYQPGTVIAELEDGSFFPVFTKTLGENDNREEIDTILYLIYTGRANFDSSINLPKDKFTLGGAKSVRIFPKNQSNRFSLLANLINWGKKDYKTNVLDKQDIYIQSGKVFFVDPMTGNATFINAEDVLNTNKNTALVAFLSQKRFNVSAIATQQESKYHYFHPVYNPKTQQLTFKEYNSYNDYLLSKLTTFTFVNPEGQMMASRNVILKTDAQGIPILSNTPTATTVEVEPDYPNMEDVTWYESFFSDMSAEEAAAFEATPEKLATASKLFEQTKEEEVPTEVKTIKPKPSPTTTPTASKGSKPSSTPINIGDWETLTSDQQEKLTENGVTEDMWNFMLSPEEKEDQIQKCL